MWRLQVLERRRHAPIMSFDLFGIIKMERERMDDLFTDTAAAMNTAQGNQTASTPTAFSTFSPFPACLHRRKCIFYVYGSPVNPTCSYNRHY